MCSADQLEEIRAICPGAAPMADGTLTLIHLPALTIQCGGTEATVEALLCLSSHDGYPSRLFISQRLAAGKLNWQTAVVLGRTWHTWSWQGVSAGQRPAQVLAQLLMAFR